MKKAAQTEGPTDHLRSLQQRGALTVQASLATQVESEVPQKSWKMGTWEEWGVGD